MLINGSYSENEINKSIIQDKTEINIDDDLYLGNCRRIIFTISG